jgi:hypothetical protein
MALAALAAFWVIVALFLLFAPDDVFRSARPASRRYGAIGCLVFAGFCLIGLLAM